jgi:putative membrane protein
MRRSDGWIGDDSDSPARLVLRLLISAAAVWAASHVVAGISPLNAIVPTLLVGLILGILNALIKPLFQLITCPLQILTLGLFTFIVNAIMLLLTSWVAERVGIGFTVAGFFPALLGAIVISVVSWILSRVV